MPRLRRGRSRRWLKLNQPSSKSPSSKPPAHASSPPARDTWRQENRWLRRSRAPRRSDGRQSRSQNRIASFGRSLRRGLERCLNPFLRGRKMAARSRAIAYEKSGRWFTAEEPFLRAKERTDAGSSAFRHPRSELIAPLPQEVEPAFNNRKLHMRLPCL